MKKVNDSIKIAAIVVTYNKPEYLRRCIDLLLLQSRTPDIIYVIDNCSDVPAERIVGDLPVHIIRTEENIGGGGGFYIGQKLAYEDYDALWLMDDDCLASCRALEILTKYHLEDQSMILNACVERHESMSADAVSVFDDRGVSSSSRLKMDFVEPFIGTFIPSSVIRKIGFVKLECFIWGDEAEYIVRSSAFGIKRATVQSALVFHPKNRQNSFHIRPFGRVLLAPPPLDRHYFRNAGYISNKSGIVNTLKFFISNIISYTIKGRLRQIPTLVFYGIDGVFDTYRLKPSRRNALSVAKRAIDAASLSSSRANEIQ